MPGYDFIFPVIIDKVGMVFVNLVLLISSCVFLFSSSYMGDEKYLGRFIYLVFLFVASICLLIFIPNIVALLIG